MKYFINHFTWKKYNRIVKEYYIENVDGVVVAGDFSSYKAALSYLKHTILRKPHSSK